MSDDRRVLMVDMSYGTAHERSLWVMAESERPVQFFGWHGGQPQIGIVTAVDT